MSFGLRRKEVFWFLVVAFVWSWTSWAPITLATYGVIESTYALPPTWFHDFLHGRPLTAGHWLAVCGGLGPIVAAHVVTLRYRGAVGVGDLWEGLSSALQTPVRWYVIALVLPVLYHGLAAAAAGLVTETALTLGTGPLAGETTFDVAGRFALTVAAITAFIVVEEMGWRAFLQPRLQNNMTALGASVWIAVIWAYWHFPYYMILFKSDSVLQTMAILLLFTPIAFLPLTILYTFVYNGSGGSLFAAMLLHGVHNAAFALFGLASEQDGGRRRIVFVMLITMLMAMLVTRIYGGRNLAPRQRQILE